MRARSSRRVPLVIALGLMWGCLALPTAAPAKVFFYAITLDGDLVKYDPDLDRIVQFRPGVGQRYINRRNEDTDGFAPTRIMDLRRGRIVTFFNEDPGVVLLDVATGRATELTMGPPGTVEELRHLVYPRQGPRFYVSWLRRMNPADPPEAVMTAVDLAGRILGTTPSVIAEFRGYSLPHQDGQTFYVLNEPNLVLRVDGETLSVRETHDLSAAYRSGTVRGWIADVRDGRALLAEAEGTRSDKLDPRIIFTVDLASRAASSRIVTGLGSSALRLIPGGRSALVQEARDPFEAAGAGRLHFYDVATGTKLGIVSFRADDGAALLGFHPDGRRLFIQALTGIARRRKGRPTWWL